VRTTGKAEGHSKADSKVTERGKVWGDIHAITVSIERKLIKHINLLAGKNIGKKKEAKPRNRVTVIREERGSRGH